MSRFSMTDAIYGSNQWYQERQIELLERLVTLLESREPDDAPRVRPPMTVTEKGERRAA
jgi:hypothetical protein